VLACRLRFEPAKQMLGVVVQSDHFKNDEGFEGGVENSQLAPTLRLL